MYFFYVEIYHLRSLRDVFRNFWWMPLVTICIVTLKLLLICIVLRPVGAIFCYCCIFLFFRALFSTIIVNKDDQK